MTFNHLPADQQRDLFAAAARTALARWMPGVDAALTLIALRSNAVFAAAFPPSVTSNGYRMVVRVNWPGRKSLRDIEGELLWMDALHRAGVPVPETVFQAEAVRPPDSPSPLICTLFSFVDGEQIAPAAFTPAHAAAVGRVIAQMHAVDTAALTPAMQRPRLDYDGLFGAKSIYRVDAEGEALLAPHRPALDAVTGRVRDIFRRLEAEGGGFGMIHGDLKPDNMLFVAPDAPRLLDFDDCGRGFYLYEFAPLLLFLKPAAHYDDLKAALWEHYTARRPLPAWQFDALETLAAGRFAASCLWVAAHHQHPAYRDNAAGILAERVARLAQFLTTGAL